ncbi:hypothetical protein WA026_008626 [Henosepilachna vigintioctopunctata]|uniref:Uncharacterized protein n=1 Tax=Henosepilachna vigintioctopunctata TaxID=420089 RepID=A0AAW1UGC5_9CUCU
MDGLGIDRENIETSMLILRSPIMLTKFYRKIEAQPFKCCGTEGKFEWVDQPIPLSCCHNYEMDHRPSEYCEYHGKGRYLYEEGCMDKLTDKMKIYARIIIGISVGSAYVKVSIFRHLHLTCFEYIRTINISG